MQELQGGHGTSRWEGERQSKIMQYVEMKHDGVLKKTRGFSLNPREELHEENVRERSRKTMGGEEERESHCVRDREVG